MGIALVTGVTGLLGSSLVPLLKLRGCGVITYARSGDAEYLADLSVTDEVFNLLDKTRPEIIINLVGLTDVDLCETQPNQAYLLNVRTVENIAKWIVWLLNESLKKSRIRFYDFMIRFVKVRVNSGILINF